MRAVDFYNAIMYGVYRRLYIKAKGKWYEDGGIYDGSFSTTGSRIKCGYGTMRWNDGAVYRGQWRNNEYNGRGKHVEGKNCIQLYYFLLDCT